jgi:hypothetical protein
VPSWAVPSTTSHKQSVERGDIVLFITETPKAVSKIQNSNVRVVVVIVMRGYIPKECIVEAVGNLKFMK